MAYPVEFRPVVLKGAADFQKRDLVRIKKRIADLAAALPDPTTTKMKGNDPFPLVKCGDSWIIGKVCVV